MARGNSFLKIQWTLKTSLWIRFPFILEQVTWFWNPKNLQTHNKTDDPLLRCIGTTVRPHEVVPECGSVRLLSIDEPAGSGIEGSSVLFLSKAVRFVDPFLACSSKNRIVRSHIPKECALEYHWNLSPSWNKDHQASFVHTRSRRKYSFSNVILLKDRVIVHVGIWPQASNPHSGNLEHVQT